MTDSVSSTTSGQASDSSSLSNDNSSQSSADLTSGEGLASGQTTQEQLQSASPTTEEQLKTQPTELETLQQTQTTAPAGDWTENWFSAGNHKYDHLSEPVCEVIQPECTQAVVVDALNSNGVHPNQEQSFVPGQEYVADVDIPGPFGSDRISTTGVFNEQGEQIGIRNETLPDHILHPGIVERTIVLQDGAYHISTQGGGAGIMGGPNTWFDEQVWSGVDQSVINQLNQ